MARLNGAVVGQGPGRVLALGALWSTLKDWFPRPRRETWNCRVLESVG